MWNVGFCKSLEFPETPKLPPLGRSQPKRPPLGPSQRLGGNSSDAVQTLLQATESLMPLYSVPLGWGLLCGLKGDFPGMTGLLG